MAGTVTPIAAQRSQARQPRADRAEEWLAASDLQLIPARESPIPPHDDAVGRLEGALVEQGRRRQYEAAFETSLEPIAYARLCEANERVATRTRWLEWITTGTGTEGDRQASEEDEMTLMQIIEGSRTRHEGLVEEPEIMERRLLTLADAVRQHEGAAGGNIGIGARPSDRRLCERLHQICDERSGR